MERENKKIRDDYKRDYNEAVRVSTMCCALLITLILSATRPLLAAPRSQIQASSSQATGSESFEQKGPHVRSVGYTPSKVRPD